MSDTHARSVAYVRGEFIPERPAPVRETGAVRWLRRNLFSSVPYALLTLATLWVIWALVSAILPWIVNGVWTASSIRQCREMMDGAGGGCFAVLTERWNQLLFGFSYPSDAYWRPFTAFVLLFVCAAPVLFPDLPRRSLVLTLIYPFVAYWLIWGGTALAPAMGLVGLVAGYGAAPAAGGRGLALRLVAATAAAFAIWRLGGWMAAEEPRFLALPPVESRNIGGFMLNMILGTVCVSLSLPFGILLALGRQSRLPIIKMLCIGFIEFIRGVPLITLLFVANVVLAYFLPPGTTFDLILRVIIMITMFASAYIAEVVRGGLAALPRGQYEGAESLGLDYWQSMRLIILPQALKISIPGIVNVAVGLFKDTTLVSIISMFDIVGMIRGPILASTDWNGVYWELYGFAALLFFAVCYSISQYSQWLERKLATDSR